MEDSYVDGKIYSIPFQRSTEILFYNKDAFKEVGLDPEKAPATWDELVEDAKLLTNENRYGVGIALNSGSAQCQKTERQQHGGTDQPRQKRRNAREDVPITGVTPSSNFSIGRALPGRCRLRLPKPKSGKNIGKENKITHGFLTFVARTYHIVP